MLGPRAIQITETILFVYNAENFPFIAQQNITIFGIWISEDSDNWISNFLLYTKTEPA